MRKLKWWLCFSMSNDLDLFPGWSNLMTALFSEVITFDVFDLMPCSPLINPSAELNTEKKHLSISLYPSCSSFYLLLQVLRNQNGFTKTLQPSRVNACFWGVLPQLYSLEAFVKHSLEIHLHVLSNAFKDIMWD